MRKRDKIISVMGLALVGSLMSTGGASATERPELTLDISGTGEPALMSPTGTDKASANFSRLITATMNNTGSYILSATPEKSNLTSDKTNCGRNNPNCVEEIAATTGEKTLAEMENQWGYRVKPSTTLLTGDVFTDEDKYKGMSGETELFRRENVNYTTETSEYCYIDFGATVDQKIAAGTYSNTVTISAVATPISMATFMVNYYDNASGATVTGMPSETQVSLAYPMNVSPKNYTISDATPSRGSGWTFLGWATSAGATVASYSAGQEIDIVAETATSDGVLDLYAVWSDMPAFFRITYMDEMSTEVCKSVDIPNTNTRSVETEGAEYNRLKMAGTSTTKISQKTLLDRRDGKSYVVRRMLDGNCWMAQNLDLDLHIGTTEGANCTAGDSSTSGDMGTCKDGKFVKLTSDNSNISSATWNISGSNKGYATQTAEGTTWDDYGRAGGIENTYEVRSYDSGDKCATASGSKDTADTVAACAAGTRGTAHVGNYYNWPAATAGTGTYAISKNGTNVSSSICPKNWKLPTGSQTSNNGSTYTMGQINTLLSKAPGVGEVANQGANTTMTDDIKIALTSAPYSLVRSGYYNYGSDAVNYVGAYGFLWSSTAYTADSAYRLYFNPSYVYPGTNNGGKGYGYPVRRIFVP